MGTAEFIVLFAVLCAGLLTAALVFGVFAATAAYLVLRRRKATTHKAKVTPPRQTKPLPLPNTLKTSARGKQKSFVAAPSRAIPLPPPGIDTLPKPPPFHIHA